MPKINPGELVEALKKQISDYSHKVHLEESGEVIAMGDGIAHIYGLTHAQSGEMLTFENGTKGLVLNLNEESIGAVIFGPNQSVKEGERVFRTKHSMEVPTGKGLLGRVVDALGNPIDGKGPLKNVGKSPIEAPLPALLPGNR
jgi:F-type H+-transporting ATPase subunit alpha